MQISSCISPTILDFVSGLFGPFDERLDFQGVQLTDQRTPFTSYPLPYSKFRVQINLPAVADEDWKVAQLLAHELVHCLTPNGMPSPRATILEEGLAEHCSIHFMRANYTIAGSDFEWADGVTGAYRTAFDLIEEVIAHEGLEGMRAGIRSLRAETGMPFADIFADQLAQHLPNSPRPLLHRLSEPFATLAAPPTLNVN